MPLSPGDLDRLLDLLSNPDSLSDGLEKADQALRQAYWTDKNVGIIAWLGGVVLPLVHRPMNDADRSVVKTIAFNVASFLWRGWDEPGITINQDQHILGRQAAEINLMLANDLDKPLIAKSRAHWMLAAYYLVDRDFSAAAEKFGIAAEQAKEDGNVAEELLSLAFADLAKNSPDLDSRLDALRAQENGEAYAGQVVTAARVCGFKIADH